MSYEAPVISEVGAFSDLTLGKYWPIQLDDNSYWWGSTPGSR